MGTARQVLFINIEGGMSQVDTLDAKEGPWTPGYFDIRSFRRPEAAVGLMKNLPGVLDKITVVRSMAPGTRSTAGRSITSRPATR